MNPNRTFIQGEFFEQMAFVTNVFVAIFLCIGLVLLFLASKFQSRSSAWMLLLYSIALMGLGVLLFQHQVKHYVGGVLVFITSFTGLYRSLRILFKKS